MLDAVWSRKTDIRQGMPNHPAFKERTVKIVSGGRCDLFARIFVFTDKMAGFYQAVDRIGDFFNKLCKKKVYLLCLGKLFPSTVNLNVAKVEDASDPRRQG